MPSTTPSACASTSCRSRRRRSCAASAPRRRAAAGKAVGAQWPIRRSIVGIDGPEPLARALRDAQYIADEGLVDGRLSGAGARQAAAARRRAGRRQDRGGEGDRLGAGARTGAAAVLRGHRRVAPRMYEWNFPRQMLAIRQAGDAYVNLYARRVSDRAADAAGAAAAARPRPADRRDRPLRPRVRGVPARIPVRLLDLDPRARHHPRRRAAGRGPDLQPDARTARGAAAPLRLSLDRLSRPGARSRRS